MMVKNIGFSKKRLLKYITNLNVNSDTGFGTFLKMGGSRGQVLAVLKQSEDLQYIHEGRKKVWRKIECLKK